LREEITVAHVALGTTSHLAGLRQVLLRPWTSASRAAPCSGAHLSTEEEETWPQSWKAAGMLLVESNQGFGDLLSRLDRLPLVNFNNLPFYLKRNVSFFCCVESGCII